MADSFHCDYLDMDIRVIVGSYSEFICQYRLVSGREDKKEVQCSLQRRECRPFSDFVEGKASERARIRGLERVH